MFILISIRLLLFILISIRLLLRMLDLILHIINVLLVSDISSPIQFNQPNNLLYILIYKLDILIHYITTYKPTDIQRLRPTYRGYGQRPTSNIHTNQRINQAPTNILTFNIQIKSNRHPNLRCLLRWSSPNCPRS